jgi:hypothetical protein
MYFKEFLDKLPQAEMFQAHNVFHYFHSNKSGFRNGEMGDGGYLINLEQFPSVAPPFPVFFIDGGGGIGETDNIMSQRGCLFVAKPIMDAQHKSFSKILQHQEFFSSRLALKEAGVAWILYAIPFFQIKDMLYEPLTCAIFPVLEDGRMYFGPDTDPRSIMLIIDEKGIPSLTKVFSDRFKGELDWMGTLESFPVHNAQELNYTFFAETLKGDDQRMANFIAKFGSLMIWPSLLTLSFLNCRNVEIIEHDPLTTRQLRKQSEKRREKTGYGLIKFRTLEIELIKRVLNEEGDMQNQGLGVALHRCRGHFKDYRDGKGLYGKHKNVYWWDDQMRGDPGYGTVIKDYKISDKILPSE